MLDIKIKFYEMYEKFIYFKNEDNLLDFHKRKKYTLEIDLQTIKKRLKNLTNYELFITYIGVLIDFQHVDIYQTKSPLKDKHYFLLKLLNIIIYRSENIKYVSNEDFKNFFDQNYDILFTNKFGNNKNLRNIIFTDRVEQPDSTICEHKLKHHVRTHYKCKYLFF